MRRNKIITINKRNLTSIEETRYTDSLMERLVSSTVPTSDTVATATVLDGFTVDQSDYLGGNWSFTRHYNATGITTTQTDPRGITTSTQTDIAGRPIIQTDGEGNETTTTYSDCCNNPASITDALGNTVNYKYDIRNRKIAEYGTGIQPATYSYDDADRMTTLRTFRVDDSAIITDPTGRADGDTTTWAYHDATGLQLSKTFADGTQETRSYNALNQLATITNARGLTQTFAYNSKTAELVSQNFASTPDRNYSYNHLGQLLSVSDESGSQQFSYNNYSDLLTESTSIANQSYSRTEQYDKVGRNIGYQLQRDGSTTHQNRYAYDNRGRIATAGFYANGWQDFPYDYLTGTSILSTLEHPNGIVSTRSYEPNRNLLISIVDAKNGTTLSNKAYSYDAIGRPTARTMNERSDTFAYDSKSQLTAAQLGSDNYGYSYDNIGNRKTAQELAEEITYAANSTNEYTAINDFTPEFDADGNQTRLQTSTGIWNVEYNAENRPTKFTSEDSSTIVEAAYDYMGRRAWKKVTVNGNVNLHETYIYRAYLQIASIDLRGANAGHFITWDPTQPTATRPLAIEKNGKWYSYGLDLSKNVTELYSAEGTIATSYQYSPFGAAEATGSESTLNPIQWSSEIADEKLGLVYYNYRHYNPADGRWINRDPIAEEGGLNQYGFLGNRAWTWDDLGLKTDISRYKLSPVYYENAPERLGGTFIENPHVIMSIVDAKIIIQRTDCLYCITEILEPHVQVKSSQPSYDQHIAGYTSSGVATVIEHEERRILVYEYADIYLSSIKSYLEGYCCDNQEDLQRFAVKEFNESLNSYVNYIRDHNIKISSEMEKNNLIYDSEGKISGIKKKHDIPRPILTAKSPPPSNIKKQ